MAVDNCPAHPDIQSSLKVAKLVFLSLLPQNMDPLWNLENSYLM